MSAVEREIIRKVKPMLGNDPDTIANVLGTLTTLWLVCYRDDDAAEEAMDAFCYALRKVVRKHRAKRRQH